MYFAIDFAKKIQKNLPLGKIRQNYPRFSWKKVYKNSAKQELYNEISKIRKSGSKKVKPGYKKKIEKEVERAKSRYRREIIRKDIRKQREERYKKEAKNARQ